TMSYSNRGLDLTGEFLGARIVAAAPCRDVEVSLFNPGRLEPVCERAEGVHDLPADSAVQFEVGRDEDELRAAAGRLHARHGRANAVLAGLIARGQDDAPRVPPPVRADGGGPAFEGRVPADPDGRLRRRPVHVGACA